MQFDYAKMFLEETHVDEEHMPRKCCGIFSVHRLIGLHCRSLMDPKIEGL
jgi:hypothetical protein